MLNESYIQYKYNCYYKHWLIGQIDLVCDLLTHIQKNEHILTAYKREFTIPDINSFESDNNYIDTNGFIAVKSIRTKDPHCYIDHQMIASYELINDVLQCTSIVFYYEYDQFHYYTIDIRNSKIVDVKFIKQEYDIINKTDKNITIILDNPIMLSY